jgi:hypothetical protein
MTEIQETTAQEAETKETKPPFQIGEFVVMRSCALKLVRFSNYPKNDIGVVLNITQKNKKLIDAPWLVTVYWQKHKPKNRSSSLIKHTRLKKLRIKKNAK